MYIQKWDSALFLRIKIGKNRKKEFRREFCEKTGISSEKNEVKKLSYFQKNGNLDLCRKIEEET